MAGFSDSMRRPARRLALRGSIEYLTGAVYELTAEDFVSARISEGVDSGILPGSVISARCALAMDNSGGNWLPGGAKRGMAELTGAQITLEIGVMGDDGWLYAPMGVYICEEAVSEVNSAVMELECHDTINSRTGRIFDDVCAYPCAAADIFMEAARQAGYDYQGLLPGDGLIVDQAPDWGEDATLRQVMGYVAALAGSCVLTDRWGFLDMRPLAGARTAFVIYPGEYMERTFQEGHFGPVNAVEVATVNGRGDSESESAVIAADSGAAVPCVMRVSGNPLFVTGGSHLQGLVAGMLENVSGLEYDRCTVVWRGDPDLSPGRLLRIVGLDGEDTYCTISRQTLTFENGFSAECVCGVPEISASGALPSGAKASGGGRIDLISSGMIAANEVNTQSLTAGTVSADRVNAGTVAARRMRTDTLEAGAMTLPSLEAGRVAAEDELSAPLMTGDQAVISVISAQRVEAGAVEADTLTAERLEARSGHIEAATMDSAQISGGSIGSARAVRLDAEVVETGRLVLLGGDGARYVIGPDTEGITVEEAGDEPDGGALVASTVTAETIEATSGLLNRLTAGSIDAASGKVTTLQASDITSAGELRLTSESVRVTGALTAGSVSAPDVAPGYGGPNEIAVVPGESGEGVFPTLAAACAALSGRRVDGDILISLPSDAAESGTATLAGVYGTGSVMISGAAPGEDGSRYLLTGMTLRQCGVHIAVTGVDIAATGRALEVSGCASVYVNGCGIESDADCGAYIARGSVCEMRNCALSGARAAHVRLSRAALVDVCGSGGIYVEYSFLACQGSTPEGGILPVKSWVDSEGTIPTREPSGGGEVLTTVSLTPVSVGSLIAYSWISDEGLVQGYSTYYGHSHGVMWFPLDGIAGRQVRAATITLTGGETTGLTGTMAVGIATTQLADMGGDPRQTMVSYGIIGSISSGETATFSLPVAAVQALADGTAAALMLDSGETVAAEGYEFSANYGFVEGVSGETPVLTVSYI